MSKQDVMKAIEAMHCPRCGGSRERCCGRHFADLLQARDAEVSAQSALIRELVEALRRKYNADEVLITLPHDCDKEDHEAAMEEHDAAHLQARALLLRIDALLARAEEQSK